MLWSLVNMLRFTTVGRNAGKAAPQALRIPSRVGPALLTRAQLPARLSEQGQRAFWLPRLGLFLKARDNLSETVREHYVRAFSPQRLHSEQNRSAVKRAF